MTGPPREAPALRRFLGILGAAADGVLSSRVRSVVCVLAVAAPMFWIISALALSQGLRREADRALEGAADLIVTGDAFGVDTPLEAGIADELRALPGVDAVVPRIVGRVQVAEQWVVVVALDLRAVEETRVGLTTPPPGQLRIGEALARRAGWSAGKNVLLEAQHTLTFEVQSTFEPGAGLGSAYAVVAHFDDARELFQQSTRVSDLLVYCRAGYAGPVSRQLARDPRLRVQTLELMHTYLDRAYSLRAGAVSLLFAFALALVAPLFLLIADLGASPRRQEIAILKGAGWSTREVLLLCQLENALLALFGAAGGFLLSWVFVELLGAPLLRGYFVPGSAATAGALELPAVWSGTPLVLGALLSVVLTSAASAVSVWRSTVVPPATGVRA